MTEPQSNDRTNWPRVALVVAAGCAAAAHIGKVPVALPVVAADLHLDLKDAATLTSIYSLVSALCGLLIGLTASRFGALRLVAGGLVLSSIASVAGALAGAMPLLLASRVVEGLGYIMVGAAAPSLIVAVTRTDDRRVALGLWGAYVPAGSSMMMLAGAAIIGAVGWRGVWGLAALVSAALAVALWIAATRATAPAETPASVAKVPWRVAARDALSRQALLLAGCFLVYSALYLTLTAFLPLMLVQRLGLPASAAGLAGAAVTAANIIGNVGAGWLAYCRWPVARVVGFAAIGMGLASIAVYADETPLAVRVIAAACFTAVGGLIPGTLLGVAPRIARTPAAAAGVVGLMIQGAGIGQLLGPPLFARMVEWVGWWQGAGLFMAVATAALLAMVARIAVAEPAEKPAAAEAPP